MGNNSRTERLRKTKLGIQVAHITCDSDTTFKVKRSKVKVRLVYSPRRLCTGSGSGQRVNVLSVGNCCYVIVCRRGGRLGGARRPRGDERGGEHIVSPRAQLVKNWFSVGLDTANQGIVLMHARSTYTNEQLIAKRSIGGFYAVAVPSATEASGRTSLIGQPVAARVVLSRSNRYVSSLSLTSSAMRGTGLKQLPSSPTVVISNTRSFVSETLRSRNRRLNV